MQAGGTESMADAFVTALVITIQARSRSATRLKEGIS